MARTSPVHYIAPSAISITPNANNSSNDLAVYVAKGTKIKVRSKGIPQLDFDPSTNTYQEWTLSGRNRRLADSTKPYTIYARLRKTDKTKGYLVFAAKTQDGDNWKDKYAYVTMDGLATGTVNSDDNTYWWIKLGDVSVPESGQRTVTLDTGILGTDQYNEDWVLNPDALPLRVKLSCLIDDQDAGQTPYVPWNKSVTMTASLVEGWSTVAEYLVNHWTIIRNTGNAAADAAWPSAERAATFGSTGAISLAHVRDADDFNEAVATTFTVTAWGTKASDSSSGEDDNSSSSAETLEPLASVTITMFAETLEVYTLETSDAAVTYNPLTDTYSPADGVTMRIRAKAQDGTMTYLSQQQITAAQLHVYYLPVGQEDSGEEPTPELTFSNGVATLPVSVFQAGKSINLWLENGAQVKLDRTTVAYVRYGEKGDTPINIYRWYKEGLTPLVPTATNSDEPAPASGDASGAANVYPLNKWSKTSPDQPETGKWMLWMCTSIKHGNGTIDAWTGPVCISGADGDPGADGSDREYIYKRLTTYPFSGTLPANITTGTVDGVATPYDNTIDDWVPDGWSDNALPATASEKYVYEAQRIKQAGNNQTWGAFTGPYLRSNWGVQGMDGDGVQYVYRLFDHELTDAERTSNIPTKPASQNANGEWIPTGWSDDPEAPTLSLPYCYCSIIKRINGTWGSFEKLGLWSKWSEDGADGEDTAMAVCMPAVVSIPTDGNGLAKEDFEKTVTVVIYTNSSDLTSPEIQVTAGGGNVEVSDASMTPYGSGDITFNNETSVFANGEFDGETLVLGDGTSFSMGTLRVKARKGDTIDEHLCQLMVYGYDTDGTQYRARTSLGIQRNVRGTDGDTPLAVYAWNQSTDTPPTISGNAYPPTGWSKRITTRPGDGWYLWMAESTRHADGTIDAWGVPVRITGEDGDPGADAKDMEWIYRLDTDSGYNGTTGTAPDTDPDSPTYGQRIAVSGDTRYTTDDFVPTDWSDNPLSVSNDHKTEYASFRKYNTSTGRWGNFSEPVVWSHWGERGTDGDGVEYVFMRTTKNVAPVLDSTQEGYNADEFRPTITNGAACGAESTQTTDDPKGTNATYLYEWVVKRSKAAADDNGQRAWTKFTGENGDYKMSLWANWSKDGENVVRLDISNEMDAVATDSTGKITAARTVQTIVHLYDGSAEVDISAATLSVSGGPGTAIAAYSTAASGKGKKLSWAFVAGSTMADTYNVSIYYTYGGTTYQAVFTITASKGQAVWQLKPSQSSIIYSRQSDNTLTSSNDKLSLTVVKIDGESSSELTPSASGQTIRYSLTAMPTSTATSSTVFAWPSDNSLTVASTTDNVYIAMFSPAGVLLDRETVPVVCDGLNGQNSVRLDVDNEMDTIQTDSTGKVTAARTVQTIVHLYDGSAEVDISAATLSVSGGPGTAIATYSTAASGKGKKLSWAFKAGQTMNDVYNISIAYTYNGTAYTATFTVSASKGQAVYQLKPSMTAIPFRRSSGNTLTPSSQSVGLSILKIDGGSTAEYSQVPTGLTVRYSTSTMPTTTSAGTGWTSGAISVDSSADNLHIALFNSAGTLIDRETIPVVRDGQNGADGQNGQNGSQGPQGIYEEKQYGRSSSSTSYGSGYLDTNYGWQSAIPVTSVYYPFIWQRTRTYNPANGSYSDWTYARLTGEPGSEGRKGLWYSYAGVWGTDTTSVTNTSTQGWYVKYGDKWYMNVKAADSPNTNTPGGSGWEEMKSEFKYYIARAYFGDYAHLGSFIINSDWMISQYGVLVDSSGKETKVDGGGANPIVLYGNNVHSGTIIVRVQFTSSGTASITATASSEGSYDKGYVKNSGGSTLIEVSGTQSETINQSVSSGGYIDLSYTKDGSVSGHDDKITFNISGVGYTLSLVSATSGMTYTGSSSSGGVIPSDPYTYFDPTDPMAATPPSSGYKFRPNVAIDGLTGKTYQNDAYIKGKVYATDGEFTGIIHADSGEFKGDIIVTSGSNTVKINSSGFEGRWGSDGIKLGTSGLQRWHPDTQSWVNMYGNRYVKIVSASSYQISVHDDFIVSTSTNTKLILPAGTDGKVISIKTIGHTVGLYPGKTSYGGDQYIVTDHDITNDHQDINNYDRVELVYYGVRWYWNFMSI